MLELRDIQRTQKDQGYAIRELDARLKPLENFKVAYEAATKALEGVATKPGGGNLNKDFVNVVLKFITLLSTLVALFYLIIQSLHK